MPRVAIITSDRSVSLQTVSNHIKEVLEKNGIVDVKMILSPVANPVLYKDVSTAIIVMTFDPAWVIPYCYLYHSLRYRGKQVFFYATVEGRVKPPHGAEWIHRELSFIANSEYTRQKLSESGYRVEDIIYHGVNVKEIQSFKWKAQQLKEQLGIGDNEFIIGYIAGGYLRKGHDLFAEVIRIVEEKDPSIRFVVLTDKRGSEYYRKTQRAIILPDFGKLSKGDVYGLYHMFDLYVQASLSEGFGLPVLEALAAGKPVVHPDYKPLSEITTEETSFRVEVVSVDYKREVGAILYELHYYNPMEMAETILYAKDEVLKNRSDYKKKCIKRAKAFDYLKTYNKFTRIIISGGGLYDKTNRA